MFASTHTPYAQNIDQFDDIGPCVIMASPGMMQSGLSRQLFEAWCTDKRNGVIIAGYCVEGTLAKVREGERERERGLLISEKHSSLTLNVACVRLLSYSARDDRAIRDHHCNRPETASQNVRWYVNTMIICKIIAKLSKNHFVHRLHFVCRSH